MAFVSGVEPNFVYLNLDVKSIYEMHIWGKCIVAWRRELTEVEYSFRALVESTVRRFVLLFHIVLSVETKGL